MGRAGDFPGLALREPPPGPAHPSGSARNMPIQMAGLERKPSSRIDKGLADTSTPQELISAW
jgi:hypothetical protein